MPCNECHSLTTFIHSLKRPLDNGRPSLFLLRPFRLSPILPKPVRIVSARLSGEQRRGASRRGGRGYTRPHCSGVSTHVNGVLLIFFSRLLARTPGNPIEYSFEVNQFPLFQFEAQRGCHPSAARATRVSLPWLPSTLVSTCTP